MSARALKVQPEVTGTRENRADRKYSHHDRLIVSVRLRQATSNHLQRRHRETGTSPAGRQTSC